MNFIDWGIQEYFLFFNDFNINIALFDHMILQT